MTGWADRTPQHFGRGDGLLVPASTAMAASGTEWLRALRRVAGRPAAASGAASYEVLPGGGIVRSHRLARLEAALLIADSPVSPRRLAQIARLIDAEECRTLVDVLNDAYDRERSAFRVEVTAGGFVLMTRAVLAPWLDRLHQRQSQTRLSQPAMETLTIVAYRQPVTRADVEAIRGVQSAEMIRQLMDRGLVRVAGEDDSLGRPFLYETTRQFLSMFGLQQVSELPDYEQLRRQAPDPDPDPSAVSRESGDAEEGPAAGDGATEEAGDAVSDPDSGASRPAA